MSQNLGIWKVFASARIIIASRYCVVVDARFSSLQVRVKAQEPIETELDEDLDSRKNKRTLGRPKNNEIIIDAFINWRKKIELWSVKNHYILCQ